MNDSNLDDTVTSINKSIELIIAEISYDGDTLYRRPIYSPIVQETLLVMAYQEQVFGSSHYSVEYFRGDESGDEIELLLCDGKDDDFRTAGHLWHCPECDIHLTSLGLCPNCGIRYKFGENAPTVLLRYIDVIQILEKELRYCIENQDKAFTVEYRKGFINGLIQAKYLVTQLTHIQKEINDR